MPPGLLKNFIDKLSIHYTRGTDFSKKKGAVIAIGTHIPSVEKNAQTLEEVLKIFKIQNVKTLIVKGTSEIPEKDYILKQKENPNLLTDLENLAEKITH